MNLSEILFSVKFKAIHIIKMFLAGGKNCDKFTLKKCFGVKIFNVNLSKIFFSPSMKWEFPLFEMPIFIFPSTTVAVPKKIGELSKNPLKILKSNGHFLLLVITIIFVTFPKVVVFYVLIRFLRRFFLLYFLQLKYSDSILRMIFQ